MANVNRSPTFERWFKKNTSHEVKSAGTYYSQYGKSLNREILSWADRIYVMDLEQEMFIKERYFEYLDKVRVIGVSDQYDPDSEALIRLIEYWFKKEFLGVYP